MPILLADVFAIVASELNASTTARNAGSLSTTIDDSRHPKAEIEEVILQSDSECVRAIMMTPSHPRRNEFLTRIEVTTNGDTLPQVTAGYTNVEVYNGTSWVTGNHISRNAIERIRANSSIFGGSGASDFYYDISDGRAYFTGQKIRLDTFTYERTSECQSPEEYLSTVVHLALGRLMMKEADDMAAAQAHRNIGEAQLQMIRANDAPPAFQKFQEANAVGRI